INRVRYIILTCVGLTLAAVIPAWVAGSRPARRSPGPSRVVGRDRYGDPLPPGALARMGTVRLRHPGRAGPAAFSPNGKVLAVMSHDGSVLLWDRATGKEIRRLPGKPAPHAKCCLAFSPDGKLLATTDEAAVALWQVATGKLLRVIGLEP